MPSRPIPDDLLPWVLSCLPRASGQPPELRVIAGDASNRRYFRLCLDGSTFVVADAPPATEKNAEFVALQQLLGGAGVRVPKIVAADIARGYLLLEDLGDQVLLPLLSSDTVDHYYQQACATLMAMACADTAKAGLGSYDNALLSEELSRFDQWFVGELLDYTLADSERSLLSRMGARLVANAVEQPQVLVHRDFHSRNLMLLAGEELAEDELAVIDFQDAVVGPVTYDLVSLLKDCYIVWPEARVEQWALGYRDTIVAARIIENVDDAVFMRWFDWMGLERHMKVLGTFARLYLRDGKAAYLDDLPLVISYTRATLSRYAVTDPVFAEFRDWFEAVLMPLIEQQHWSRHR
jgi:aminoglycoside/choline kinase family phosphotransferase